LYFEISKQSPKPLISIDKEKFVKAKDIMLDEYSGTTTFYSSCLF